MTGKNLRIFTLSIIGFFFVATLCAQSLEYDPLRDPSCKILPAEKLTEWSVGYMWYPGQLSAHMQKQCKKESDTRCTYVGYPGKFNKYVYQSYFRKKVKLGKETPIKWAGPESITFYVNDKKIETSQREYVLKPGVTTLLFEVETKDRLPCLIVDGEDVSSLKDWQVSLDKVHWNGPESYEKYNKPDKRPDDVQEIIVRIFPYRYIPLINATENNGTIESGKEGCVIVDFRHEEVGIVKMKAKGKGRLYFNVGESPEEVLNKNLKDMEQRPLPVIELTDSEQDIELPKRALRYLKLESDDKCTISSVQFDAMSWPVDFLMQFECSDENFNRMWKAASASLHASMHSFYLDGIKRDYLPWAMDAVECAFAGDYLFGDEQVARNDLSIALMPPNPKVSDLGIVDYPLYALIGFKQDYMRYGKLETSLLFKDRIIQMLGLYESIQDEDGFISSKSSTDGFIPGWSVKMGPEMKGTAAYGQILLYQNFVIGSYFAELWKENALARKYKTKAETLRKSIMDHFWDNERKAFINGYDTEGKKDTRISHHAQYRAILADMYPKEHYDYLFDQILPNIKYYKEDISYEKGFEFLAYIKAGRGKDIIPFLNAVWLDWLDKGYTRFPENFSPLASREKQLVFYDRPFGLSLCHGSNGIPPVVTALYSILGFSQSDKNIAEYHFRPDLMGMDWAKGRIPIKEGFVHLDIRKNGKSTIEIPSGCIVYLYEGSAVKPKQVIKKAGKYNL